MAIASRRRKAVEAREKKVSRPTATAHGAKSWNRVYN